MFSMRVLLYFLALLTGFSAAEAARPVEAASSTSAASAVALSDFYATTVAVSADGQYKFSQAATLPSEDHLELIVQDDAISASTPVSRADCAHK
jgi:hypothetical protein